LGSVTDVEGAKVALSRLESAAATTAVAGPAVMRLGRGILCLPVGGLDDLAGAVMAETAGIGQPPEDRVFRGHLTLARAKPGTDLAALAGAPLHIAWPVRDVTLVASDTRRSGARYHVLETCHLR
jgi:2'-5' RNA ligase